MKKINWDKQAAIQLRKAISYIRKDSPKNVETVKREIIEKIDGLLNAPEKYSPDKYKKNNNGKYRAFELHHYRISYLIKEEEVVITRIRQTSMVSKEY